MNKINMLDASFFTGNRTRLAQALPGHLVVIAANGAVQSSGDLAFKFRQDSNFWYLCGIDEPDLVLLIDCDSGESSVLMPEQSGMVKEWEGEFNPAEMRSVSGISAFDSLGSLPSRLKKAKSKKQKIAYLKPLDRRVEPFGFYSNPARRHVEAIIHRTDKSPVDVRMSIARLRQIKQLVEIDAIQKAIDITSLTLKSVKSRLSEFGNESDVERAITVGFYGHGADGHAYSPIVAAGGNAAVIHYVKNNSPLDDQVLLLDVGAQNHYYAADISRNWSLKQPTTRQREIHEVLLDIQHEAMRMLKPGVIMREYQDTMEQYAFKKQREIGIKSDSYPHGLSHFLGLDVHDAGDYSIPLEEGMVMTVEPGIYLADEGVGMRIEDDVLITKTGIKNLSESIPREL